jgi:hypothetical protein
MTSFTTDADGRIYDWARCICCKQQASHGKINHLRACPDYRRPASGATTVKLGDLLHRR